MMTKKKEEEGALTVWEPPTFEGSDMLPVKRVEAVQVANIPPAVGRENVDASDLILPSLTLLQGSSDAVKNALKDHHGNNAIVGHFMLSTTGEFFEPPLRLLLVQHHRARVLFPRDPVKDPDFRGLDLCISRDAEEGTLYGDCNSCKHRLWRDNKQSPICSEQHCFVAMTPSGPAMLRFMRTSFKAGKEFVSQWTYSAGTNLWAHPVKLTVHPDVNPEGQSYVRMEMRWMLGDDTPPEYQVAAYELFKTIQEAWEQGRLGSDQIDDDE
jgi:hypothetical protein